MLFSEIESGWKFTVDSEPGVVYEKTGDLTGFRVGQPLAKIGFFTEAKVTPVVLTDGKWVPAPPPTH